jgi:cytochrome P450
MEKSPIFLGAVGSVDGQTGVSLALNQEHARQRRALGYLFTNSALLQQENLIIHHVNKLVAVFKEMEAENRSMDFSSWCNYALINPLFSVTKYLTNHIHNRHIHCI